MKASMKAVKGWRTRALSMLVIALGAMELYAPEVWASLLPDEYRPAVTIAIGVAIYILRQVTSTPPGRPS